MAQGILTEERCVQAEKLAEEIWGYKSKIEGCIATFNYVMTNTPEIQSWLKGTEAGQEIYNKVMSNNESLQQLADSIGLVAQCTEQLVNGSRRINRNSY